VFVWAGSMAVETGPNPSNP